MTVVRPGPVTPVRALKVRADRQIDLPDDLATEEPMQILLAGPGEEPWPVAVTMRTPGHDFELAAGFVVTEGLVEPGRIRTVDYCNGRDGDVVDARYNHVTVHTTVASLRPERSRYSAASSSCGVCGKATIDQVETACLPVGPGLPFRSDVIASAPDRLRGAQRAFDRTGGLHAAALFDRSGELLWAREDVGRHNAVDKVVGAGVLAAGADEGGLGLVVSGRVSFEIVQKAAMAGIAVIAAVSAPSSLAVETAARLGLTIAAFVRGGTYNVYTHPERIDFSPAPAI
ncbi:MAG TPA: formate dehydrogenase accessory sulfurtransferase FdhD [Acidimicrobiales bacterium]|nr:formate dehydrogenase accessory sulfurtransferase FdhD [Acidimicrobiales bacterium]